MFIRHTPLEVLLYLQQPPLGRLELIMLLKLPIMLIGTVKFNTLKLYLT